MATPKYEAVAVIGEREGKKVYQKVGVVFDSDKGMSLKMDCIPAGNGWNGWISFYPFKPKERQQERAPSAPKLASQQAPAEGIEDSDIPF